MLMKKNKISFTEFQKTDLRVGKVVDVSAIEGSTNLLRLKVNLGYDYGIVSIVSGIARWYKPTDLKSILTVDCRQYQEIMIQETQNYPNCNS